MRGLIVTALSLLLVSPLNNAQQRGLGISKQDIEPRVALIVGNGDYKDSPLRNATNDARDMAKALKEFGFEVIYKENVDQNGMKESIRLFGQRIRTGGVGLFYYAGHGVQVNGRNFLIPVGVVINNEYEIEYEGVDVGRVLAQMYDAGNRLNIVILDACRNNPFNRLFRSQTRGLASIDAPSGTIIAYATAPGSVANDGSERNGLYTQELLNHMRVPGLKVEEVFKRVRISVQRRSEYKQIPWESSSLIGDFYFLPPTNDFDDIPKTDSTKLPTPPIGRLEGTRWSGRITEYQFAAAPVIFEFTFQKDGVYTEYRSYDDARRNSIQLKGKWRRIGDTVYLEIPKGDRNDSATAVGVIKGNYMEGRTTFDVYRYWLWTMDLQ